MTCVALSVAGLPASAATLYKCVAANGVPNYVNRRIPNATCTVFSRYTPDHRPASRPAVAATPSPTAASAAASPAASASDTAAATRAPATPAPTRSGQGRVVSGQVYSYMQDGVRHYTSAKPTHATGVEGLRTIRYSFIETCYACGANPGVNFATLRLNTSAYQAEIAAAAREFGVEEAIVRAVIHAESAYNPMALSRAGAQGLMQLMPATARRFGVSDSYDASQNIRGGVQYLAWLLRRYDGNLTLAAAGYNAGEGAVARYGGVPPYSETQRYVQRVNTLAERYRGAVAAQ